MLMRMAAPPMDFLAPKRPRAGPSPRSPVVAAVRAGLAIIARGVLLALPAVLGRWFSPSCSMSTRTTLAVAAGCRMTRGVMPDGSAGSRALLGTEGLLLPEVVRLERASLGTTGSCLGPVRCTLAMMAGTCAGPGRAPPRGELGCVPGWPNEGCLPGVCCARMALLSALRTPASSSNNRSSHMQAEAFRCATCPICWLFLLLCNLAIYAGDIHSPSLTAPR